MRFLVLILILNGFSAPASAAGGSAAKAVTGSGTYLGKKQDGVYSFLGIRYAASFSGDRRWLPPEPLPKRERPTDAGSFSPPCPHMDKFSVKDLLSRGYVGEPDCLSLNIWVPESIFQEKDAKNAPVLVFIPGGGFQVGSSSWSPFGFQIYDGAALAKRGGVVVVSINYRLGSNGFFFDESLILRSPSVGNLGLLDQVAAFKWVKSHIGDFGGSAANITAFGSSAGAMSLCNLLMLNEAKGLIDKAVIQSGVCWLSSKEYAAKASNAITKSVGCDAKKTVEERRNCLLETPLKELTEAEPEMKYELPVIDNFKLTPVFDGVVFKDLPEETLAAGKHLKIPILMGANAHEIPPLMMKNDKEHWQRMLESLPIQDIARKRIRELYEREFPGSYDEMQSALKTDVLYVCRVRHFAELFSTHQNEPVYLYHFEQQIHPLMEPWVRGSFHGMELYYLFRHVPPHSFVPGIKPHLELQDLMSDLWVRFAKEGDVQVDPRFKNWRPYSAKNRTAGSLGDNDGVLIDPHGSRCRLIGDLVFGSRKISLFE